MASSAPPAILALIVYKISKITLTNSFTLLPMASSPFAFITILTTDTVNKTTSDEIAIGATNPCTASQNTSSMVNNNLEQQAQALFKEWFIDNPENICWSTGTFRELIQSTLNGDWGKETPTGNNIEKVYCIRGADIPEVKAGNKGKMPTRYILPKNLANKKLEAGDIVVEISGGSPTQSTGRCTAITQSLLDRYDSSMVCTNFCKAIKPKKNKKSKD